MSPDHSEPSDQRVRIVPALRKLMSTRVFVSAGLAILVLLAGLAITRFLMAQRTKPEHAAVEEPSVRVEVQRVNFEDVRVTITGYGEARARDEVVISPEVPGKVVAVHPRLETGEIIPAGDVLFAIDPRDYQTRLAEAKATVAQLKSALERVELQFKIDQERLDTFGRSRELAKADFERAQRLYEKEQIESKAFVDSKEIAYNNAVDAYDQLVQTLDLYPIRIQEAQNNLAAADAALERARIDLERTVVEAPFDARVKTVSLEANEYVTPGTDVLTLANDSMLRISVPLNSREARTWLRFDEKRLVVDKAWFNKLSAVPVEIAWTEALSENKWQGVLDRVERFDEETRTLTVVVHVPGAEAKEPRAGNLPLVEGMFCQARIPGRLAHDVVRLPAEAVGFDKDASGYRTVYVAIHDEETGEYRLRSRNVKESHVEGDYVFVTGDGLAEGELVVTTRLINPLENTLLNIEEPLPVETD